MIERTEERFALPKRLAADSAYGSAEMLNWLVNDRRIERSRSVVVQVDHPAASKRAARPGAMPIPLQTVEYSG